MLRTYGASGVVLPGQEADQGCPRRYRAQYVDRVANPPTLAMRLGTIAHEALHIMEDESLPPDEALQRVWPGDLGPSEYADVLADLNGYLERGATPADRLTNVATEQHLTAHLYDDDEHGPIHVQGYVDWLGVDPNEPHTLHVRDYKRQSRPASRNDVRASLQMRTYDWLVRRNWGRYMRSVPTPNVVVHLDALKFSDVDVRYTQDEADMFEAWLIAMARKILADKDADPHRNPGCAWCPVRTDCPSWQDLPEDAEAMLAGRPDNLDARIAWRDRANRIRLLLDKAVKDVDNELRLATDLAGGTMQAGGYTFTLEPKWIDEVDVRALHAAMGDPFYDVVRTSKTAVRKATSTWPPEQAAAVDDTISRTINGVAFTRRADEAE